MTSVKVMCACVCVCVCVCVCKVVTGLCFRPMNSKPMEHEIPHRTHLQTVFNCISLYIFVTSRPVEKKDVWYHPQETMLLTAHVTSGNQKLDGMLYIVKERWPNLS
jgi:hypothetical protein